MNKNSETNSVTDAADMRAMVNAVIATGKSSVNQFDSAVIRAFIARQSEVVGDVALEQVRSAGEVGASSGIVLFTARYSTAAGPQKRDLVLRYAPSSDTRLFYEYDLARQFKVQLAMFKRGLPVPEPLWLDGDGAHLGVCGYIMQFIPGNAPHPSAFTRGPIAEASPSQREAMIKEILAALVTIHSTDLAEYDLQDFHMNAEGEGALERAVNWYWRTWDWIDLPHRQRLEGAHRWLLENIPQGKPELMHGDSTVHNYMFSKNKLVAVLDWEMSALGRAEADLALQCVGNALFAAPKESGALQPPSQAQWLDLYQQLGGRAPEHFDYYKTFANYMIIVAVGALQRNMDSAARQSQEALLAPCWRALDA